MGCDDHTQVIKNLLGLLGNIFLSPQSYVFDNKLRNPRFYLILMEPLVTLEKLSVWSSLFYSDAVYCP